MGTSPLDQSRFARRTRPVRYGVGHCAATPPSWNIDIFDVHDWHLANGWAGFGYNVLIRRSGEIQYGRDFDRRGSHVKGHNNESLGVCLAGGVSEKVRIVNGKKWRDPEDNFTEAQYQSLIAVFTEFREYAPDIEFLGHRDFPGVFKACPCFEIKDFVSDFMGVPQPANWSEEDTEMVKIPKLLYLGTRHPAVKIAKDKLNIFLAENGLELLDSSEIFNKEMYHAVWGYQASNPPLQVDGMIGDNTWAALHGEELKGNGQVVAWAA